MDLKGVKVNFMGDSITEGVGTSCLDAMYVNRFAKETGAIVRNYGIGGTRIAQQSSKDGLSFCERFASMDKDADLIIMFGGTNDYGHGDAKFGTIDDTDYATFCGACNWFVNQTRKEFPNAKLVVMTPIHREFEEKPCVEKPEGAEAFPLATYVDAMKKIMEKQQVPVVDLFNICVIDPTDPDLKAALCPDGLHPNDAGHVLLKDCLINFLKKL